MRIISLALGALATFAFLVFITIVFGSWGTIDQSELGVKLRNGAYVTTLTPGLYFKLPLFESVVAVSLQEANLRFDALNTYSKDQQPAEVTLSVNYKAMPEKVAEIYARYGTLENAVSRIIVPRVQEESKNVFGKFNAITAIQERTRLNAEVEKAIQDSVKDFLIVESVQIENIDFSQAYEKSVEDRMIAEVEVAKLQQNLQREKVQAEIAVTQAEGRAASVIAEAQAQADAIKLKGEAEAFAIDLRGKALRDNPALIALTQAERWNGTLPTTMVPSGSVPFLELNKLMENTPATTLQ